MPPATNSPNARSAAPTPELSGGVELLSQIEKFSRRPDDLSQKTKWHWPFKAAMPAFEPAFFVGQADSLPPPFRRRFGCSHAARWGRRFRLPLGLKDNRMLIRGKQYEQISHSDWYRDVRRRLLRTDGRTNGLNH